MKQYLALGDSYTIGEDVPAEDTYAAQLVDLLSRDGIKCRPNIIAKTGWTTHNLLEALDNQKPASDYDLVTLLIGVNNQYQGRSMTEYEHELTVLIERSIALAGGKAEHVIVISIPDYGVTPFAASLDQSRIHQQIEEFNLINRTIAFSHHVQYVDIFPLSLAATNNPGLIASDGLHYSGKAYSTWATLIYPKAKAILVSR